MKCWLRVLIPALFSLQAAAANLLPAEDYLSGKGGSYLQRLNNVVNRLNDDFTIGCTNLCQSIPDLYKPLSIHCFVKDDGTVERCVWAIAKSRSWINRENGIDHDGVVNFCEFRPLVKIQDMIELVENSRAGGRTPYLDVVLPGVGSSLARAIEACLTR